MLSKYYQDTKFWITDHGINAGHGWKACRLTGQRTTRQPHTVHDNLTLIITADLHLFQ